MLKYAMFLCISQTGLNWLNLTEILNITRGSIDFAYNICAQIWHRIFHEPLKNIFHIIKDFLCSYVLANNKTGPKKWQIWTDILGIYAPADIISDLPRYIMCNCAQWRRIIVQIKMQSTTQFGQLGDSRSVSLLGQAISHNHNSSTSAFRLFYLSTTVTRNTPTLT